MFDFSRIEGDECAAIHCGTEELAEKFLKCLKEHFPSKKFWGGANHWSIYEKSTCYWPNFGGSDGLQYGSLEYAIEKNYNVYEVESLMMADLPIEASDVDIKCLFGME